MANRPASSTTTTAGSRRLSDASGPTSRTTIPSAIDGDDRVELLPDRREHRPERPDPAEDARLARRERRGRSARVGPRTADDARRAEDRRPLGPGVAERRARSRPAGVRTRKAVFIRKSAPSSAPDSASGEPSPGGRDPRRADRLGGPRSAGRSYRGRGRMSFPPLARVRQSVPQPRVADIAGDGPPPDPGEPDPRPGPGRRDDRRRGREPGDHRHPDRRPGGGRHPQGDGLPAVHRRRDGEPRRRHPRGPARAARRLRDHRPRRWASRSGPTWTPWSSAPTPSACRSTSTGTPTGPTGSSCSTGSSRTPTSAGPTSRASSRCWPSAWASATGRRQIHKLGHAGDARGPARPSMKFLVENTQVRARAWRSWRTSRTCPPRSSPLEPETILDVEPELLDRARALMGRLPFDQIDVLVVGELGKNYSGSGMDPNVIGRLMVETHARLPPAGRDPAGRCSTPRRRPTATSSASGSPT